MAQTKAQTSRGRSLDPVQLKKTSATRQDAIAFALNQRSNGLGLSSFAVLQDTFLNLPHYPAGNYPLGQLYEVLTDRPGLWYVVRMVNGVNAWCYGSGTVHDSRSNVAGYGLGANDAGLLAHLTDYAHLVEWDGTHFHIVDGEGGYIVDAIHAKSGAGWVLCDGSATDFLLDNTTNLATQSVTTPDEKTNTAVHHNSIVTYTGVINAATAPTFTGSPVNTGNDSGGGQTITQGTGATATVPNEPHTHSVTAAGTITLGGDPVKTLGVVRYFRR